MITVGLLWHSLSSGNLGVGALTESNIAIIREAAESIGQTVQFIVIGSGTNSILELEEELREKGHGLENYRIRLYQASFREQVCRCDLVVDIGEGDSFTDIYGIRRFLYLWLSKNIVCSLGKPLVLAPQTIGPFNSWFARMLAKQVMHRCARVFARDRLSSAYLNSLEITKNSSEAIDVAFKLPFTRKIFDYGGKQRVGINVSGLLFNGGYTGDNQFGLSIDYPITIRRIISWFASNPDVETHLVSHVIEPNMPIEDDMAVAVKLSNEFPGVVVAPAFSRPSEAKSYIAGLDFFTGARMHACIAAFSSGVPVVPMAYSRKFNGLFNTLGYTRIADCKNDSIEEIENVIFNGFLNRDILTSEVCAGLAKTESKINAYKNIIKSQIQNIISCKNP